jgi:hypothetical protein
VIDQPSVIDPELVLNERLDDQRAARGLRGEHERVIEPPVLEWVGGWCLVPHDLSGDCELRKYRPRERAT